MKTETAVQADYAEQYVKQHTEVTESHAAHQSWEDFPQPRSWALSWDSRGLTHDVQTTRGRADVITDQE